MSWSIYIHVVCMYLANSCYEYWILDFFRCTFPRKRQSVNGQVSTAWSQDDTVRQGSQSEKLMRETSSDLMEKCPQATSFNKDPCFSLSEPHEHSQILPNFGCCLVALSLICHHDYRGYTVASQHGKYVRCQYIYII